MFSPKLWLKVGVYIYTYKFNLSSEAVRNETAFAQLADVGRLSWEGIGILAME